MVKAVLNGQLSRSVVERAAGNVLSLVDKTRGIDGPAESPERINDNHELRDVIRQAGVEGITLLRNEGKVLPIKNVRKIAVIGPNAKRSIAGGGGSAKVNPYYLVTPFDGIKAATDAEVTFAQGCENPKWLPLASHCCETPTGDQGVIIEYYKGDRFEGNPSSIQHKRTTDLYLWDSAPKIVLPDYSFKVKTTIRPKTTGNHTISLSSVGPGRMFLNGELFLDNWNWTEEGEAMFDDSEDIMRSVKLEAGVPVDILVESTNEIRPASKIPMVGSHGYGGCRIGFQEEVKEDLLAEAVKIASEADAAIVIIGLDNEWESEGYDRQHMDLPKDGSQDRLVEAILKANPNTVIVSQSG